MFDIFKLLCDVLYLVGSQGTVEIQLKHKFPLNQIYLVKIWLNLQRVQIF